MKQLTKEQQGEIFIFSEAILWSLFPVVTLLTYSSLNPLTSLAWSTFFATLFFGGIVLWRKKWKELLRVDALKDILIGTFFIGILFYGTYFWGLQYTTAGNAAIVGLMEIFFSFLYFNVWRKEYLDKKHILGIVFMFSSALILLMPKHEGFKWGDLIILVATMMPPIGNYFQQQARKKVSTETLMFLRDLISFPFIFLLAHFLIGLDPIEKVESSIIFLFINGFLLFGVSKIFWIEGIHRISVTKAISLNSVAPFFTLIFAYFFLFEFPNFWQLGALIPMFFGVRLLTSKSIPKKQRNSHF